MRLIIFFSVLMMVVLLSCSKDREIILFPSKNYHYLNSLPSLKFKETVYVPVYSDIYHTSGEKRFLLTVTLSVRNTHLTDSMYVSHVDYYDSEGLLIRQYLKKAIFLKPLESVEFVVEERDERGGSGANFLVRWGSNNEALRPVIQAVMIGTSSQQGISFVTDGLVIETNKAL